METNWEKRYLKATTFLRSAILPVACNEYEDSIILSADGSQRETLVDIILWQGMRCLEDQTLSKTHKKILTK